MNASIDIATLASPVDRLERSGFADRRADRGGFAMPDAGALASPAADEEDGARDAAEQLIGMALVLPLLKQARESPFKSERMHGGFGEDAFASQLDQTLADRIAKRMGGQLVDAVVRDMTANPSASANGKEVDRHG